MSTSIISEEVCYDSPWEYTSAAARILNGRQSEPSNSIKFIPKTTAKPSIIPSTTKTVTSTINSVRHGKKTCDSQRDCTCEQPRKQPNSSISSNDSGISDALRQSPPNASKTSPIPSTSHCPQPSTSQHHHHHLPLQQQSASVRKQQPRTQTGRSPRHVTTSSIQTTPWTYRGPTSDDRPIEEYDSPWDYKRTMERFTNNTTAHDDDSASDYYDKVPSEVGEKREQQKKVSDRIRQFQDQQQQSSSTGETSSRSQKTQSVCVVSPIGRPASSGTSRNHETSHFEVPEPPPKPSKSPSNSTGNSNNENAGDFRSRSKNDNHSARSHSSTGSNGASRNVIQETTNFSSTQPPGSAKLRRKNLIDSESERRNRLIQHLASGEAVPTDLTNSNSCGNSNFGTNSSSSHVPVPQPAIRWSKIKKTSRHEERSAENPNVAKIAIVAPSPVKSRSASADHDQFLKMTGNTKPQSPDSNCQTKSKPPMTSPMMTQSFYDQVPTSQRQSTSHPVSQSSEPIDYEVPWEFKSKVNLDRIINGAQAEGTIDSSRASQSTSHRSIQSQGTNYSQKSRSKTPPASQKLPLSNLPSGLIKQKSHSSISTGSSKRATLNRNELSLNFGCASLNPVAEEFDLNLPLEHQGWYHGNINRSDAEHRLSKAREGSYLVRLCESNKDEYALSLKSARGFMHMKIQHSTDRGWILGYFSQPFDRIPPMIRYYSVNKLPIKGAEHMCLLHPLNEQLL